MLLAAEASDRQAMLFMAEAYETNINLGTLRYLSCKKYSSSLSNSFYTECVFVESCFSTAHFYNEGVE